MQKTIFLQLGEETRKAGSAAESFSDLLTLVHEKFGESASQFTSETDCCFYIKDQQYGVMHQLEDVDSDLYEGAVVEVRTPDYDGDAALKQELNSINQKIRALEEQKDESAAKRRKIAENVVEKPDAFVVRIRGLPWGSDKSAVLEFFNDLAVIEDTIYLFTDWQDRPNGEAYVEFETEEDCNKAKQKHNQKMGARYIEVFSATGSEMYRAQVPPPPGPLPIQDTNNLLVKMRGLPFGSSESEVVDFFHGTPIEKIHMTTVSRGTPNGEAYVEFKTDADRDMAMKYDREKIGARYIELFKINQPEAELPKYWVQ